MALNCGPGVSLQQQAENLDMVHSASAFGDAYSIRSRSTGSFATLSRYHDEPESDYDEGATELYRLIENKDWDGALSRLEIAPVEAKTWVSRREHGGAKTRWRLLPLHAVCIFRAPLALIEALIEVYRDGPQMKDDQGMLPLHLACRNGASKGVVLTLLSAFPESLTVKDRKGRTAKSLVEASSSANREAVLIAIRRFARDMGVKEKESRDDNTTAKSSSIKSSSINNHITSNASKEVQLNDVPSVRTERTEATPPKKMEINEVDYENRTVLFRLIIKKDWKSAAARAVAFPQEACTWIVTKGFNGNLRFLPLHKACVLQPPESFVESLLAAFPDGAQSTDQDGWLPLHCACFYGANDKVINTLLSAFAKASQTKDEDGRIPLHYACLKGASQAVVDVLLASFTKGAMYKDDEGRLPIHHACSKGAPEGVIDALLKASPKGAQTKDDQGRVPLHHACRKNASERIVRTLLRVYPRAAQIKDDQDKLPLHYACQNGTSPNVVGLLLTTYPESVNVQNGFGFTPLAEAKALDNPKMEPVIKILEKFKKEQDKFMVQSGISSSAELQVNILEDKVIQLEKTLAKVAVLGKEIKNDLRKNKDLEEILDNLADNLIELGGRSKTPLKSKQITPKKGLFGRAKLIKK